MVDSPTGNWPAARRAFPRRLASAVAVCAVGAAMATTVAGAGLGAAAQRSSAVHRASDGLANAAGSTSDHGSASQRAGRSPSSPDPSVVPSTVPAPPAAPTTTAATPQVVVAPTAPGAAAPGPTVPDVAALVAQVEAAGIAPGPTWTWSFGATAACGPIPGDHVGTGCTAGAAGSVTTVFSGVPGLLLVAHELANAEVENYAVPALVNLVARAAGSASWSPIDAVASCLVVHALHVQDGAAGSWACPSGLADIVGAHIRDAAFTG